MPTCVQGRIQAYENAQAEPGAPKAHTVFYRRGEVWCCKIYIRETKRILKKSLSEHEQAVKRGGSKNSIALHTHESHHGTD